MKIGIITLSASYNCGSLLQCFALKRILMQYGEVEVINFSSEASHAMYDILPTSVYSKIKMRLFQGKLLSELQNEVKDYMLFQQEKLQLNKKEYFFRDLKDIANQYDVVIAGSDQVWNVCMRDFDEAFFCGWVNKKKVAYAPSLGGHDIRESNDAERYIELINQFDFLSVRESKGKKCLEEVIGKEVPIVLDPTLLMEDDWKDFVGDRLIEEEYIFYYSWSYCYEELREIVTTRSKQTDYPVYVIDAHKWRSHSYTENKFILCKNTGPMAFLNLMYYAKECFVESFHGILFAYMFKKNFWILDIYEEYSQMDSRLRELVELVKAKERIITKYNVANTDMDMPMEYIDNIELAEKRRISFDFLEEALSKL